MDNERIKNDEEISESSEPSPWMDFSILENLKWNPKRGGVEMPQNHNHESLFSAENPITINGRNLGKREGTFKRISEHFSEESPENLGNIRRIEEEYINNYNLAKDSQITPLRVDENNKVIVKPGQLYHKIPPESSLETLANYARYGIVASEWFGIPESEGEGRYCAFLEEVIDDNTAQAYRFMRFHNKKAQQEIQFCFDMDNPIMKKLIKQDFFDYKVKKLKGETPDGGGLEQALDELVLPNSKGLSVRALENPNLPCHYWKAIPGGIPPHLINGIRINTERNPDLKANVSEITKMFPNATVFDENDNLLTV